MAPTLLAGQLIALARSNHIAVGDVVMFEHDGLEKIKRVARVDGPRVYLLGDNAQASTDSRQFGWIGMESVRGKVIWPKLRSTTLAQ
jgi:type IV secretory pathway protease TraF